MKIYTSYIRWAHGPSAEDGWPPAMDLIKESRRVNHISSESLSANLISELRDVAEVWVRGKDAPPWMVRCARAILRETEES